MTQKEFFAKLAERASRRGFRLSDGQIREKQTKCCPVTAVARHVKPGSCKGYDRCDQTLGAEILGLNGRFADLVADAADDADWTDRRKKLRTQLLKACGLAEVAA